MALFVSDEQLAREKKENEKSGFRSTFIDAEYVGGAKMATLLEAILDDNPEVTLDWVQDELEHFAGIIAQYQDEHGEDAPLSLLA